MKEKNNSEVILMAVGDVMLGGEVGKILLEKGLEHPFKYVSATLCQADIIFGNLPTPLSHHSEPNPAKPREYPFLRAKPQAIKSLLHGGFNVLSLANNHIMDFGAPALFDTMAILKKNKINYVGAGKDITDARKPLVLKYDGFKVAFLAYSCSYPAGKNKPGCAPIRLTEIKKDITKAKKIADVIIISLHHGIEYSDYPVPGHISLAHKIIDAGADLILAHHPHVLQGIEYYKKGFIAYSLGNFVHTMVDKETTRSILKNCALSKIGGITFDPNDQRPSESMIFKCILSKEGVSGIELIPVFINKEYQPTILTGKERTQLLDRINRLSFNIHNPNMPIWKILTKVDAEDNVKTVLIRNPRYIFRAFYKIRYRHIRLFVLYLFAKIQSKLPVT